MSRRIRPNAAALPNSKQSKRLKIRGTPRSSLKSKACMKCGGRHAPDEPHTQIRPQWRRQEQR